MKKLSQVFLGILIAFNSIFFLCGMEQQQILQLYKNIPISGVITSIGFNANLSYVASTYNKNDKLFVRLYDIETDAKRSCATIKGNSKFLCFDDVADNVGILTEEGKVIRVLWNEKKANVWAKKTYGNYLSLAFNKGNFFAGTSQGDLVILTSGMPAQPICTIKQGDYGKGYENKFPSLLSIAFDENKNRIGLAGRNVLEQGSGFVFNENRSVGLCDGTNEPITHCCFDSSGLLYAMAAGKLVVIDNLKEINVPVNPYYDTKFFTYDFLVTQLCFDGTNKRLFVGLDNGDIYLSDLKNAGYLGHAENHSTLLVSLGNTIKALHFNKNHTFLGIATLFKAVVYRYSLSE